MGSIEDLIEECGGFGRFQVLVIIGVFAQRVSCGWSMLQMTFAGFIPDWYCVLGRGMDDSIYYTNETLKECSVNSSYTGYQQRDCYGHHFIGSEKTVVTEWDLVCDKKWIKATITSIQMAGVLVGAISTGQLADLFGRKKTTFGFSLFHALLNFGAAFSVSWEMFAASRFFIGIGIGGILVATFPYVLEFQPTKWRSLLNVLPVWQVSVGLFSITGFLVEDWSYLHIGCGILNLPCLLGLFYVPESVRWLTLKGRCEEAERIIEKMAIVNGKTPPKHTLSVLEKVYKEEHESRSKAREYTYWDLFKGRQQRINTLVLCYLWFTISAVYYGISFGVSALSGNLYLNIFLLSIVELPPQFSTFCLNNIFGRKITSIGSLIVAAVPACGCLVVHQLVDSDSRGGWITGLSLTSKMGLGASWAAIGTWSAESYPTVIRSLGYGVVNTAARAGGIVAPFIIDFDNAPVVAYAIITAMVVLAIILSLLVPETKGKLLADSINAAPESAIKDKNGNGAIKISVVVNENDTKEEEDKEYGLVEHNTGNGTKEEDDANATKVKSNETNAVDEANKTLKSTEIGEHDDATKKGHGHISKKHDDSGDPTHNDDMDDGNTNNDVISNDSGEIMHHRF